MALSLPQLVRDYAEIDLTRMGVDSRITFTRASTRTYFDASGVLRTAAINEWPLEYDPATGVCLGRAVVPRRTNMTPRSDDITNAGWTKNGVTATSGFSAPDGSTTACLIQGTNTDRAYIRPPIPSDYGSNLNVVQSYTIFVKAAGAGSVIFYEEYYGWRVVFNPSTGMITSQALPAGGTAIAVACGNGWYRIGFTLAKTAIYMVWFLGMGESYPPGPSSQSVYAWGAQTETGEGASPYIPTAATATTRSADVATISNIVTIQFSASAGTVFLSLIPKAPLGGGPILSFDSGIDANTLSLFLTGSVTYRFISASAGSPQAAVTSSAAVAGAPNKVAFAYALNDFAISARGAAAATDTSGALPVGIARLILGAAVGNVQRAYLPIQKVRYYPRRLSNAELQALTA